jgi:hypothetical protein
MRLLTIGSSLTLAAVSLMLAGCGGFQAASTATATATAGSAVTGMKGKLHGGQQPIVNAAIQVYQAGTTGYGAGAIALAGASTTTGSDGSFSLGAFSCTSGSQLYLTATAGNPGAGTNNSSLLMVGLGLCDTVSSLPFLQVNEVTTVWALSPFMSDTINGTPGTNVIGIGAPATNQAGLAQAFADINTLVDIGAGTAPGTTASGVTVPSSEVYALANSIAACVNTTGGGPCTSLFGYTTANSVTPTDTSGAAMNIARNPGTNVSNLLALGGSTPPFPTTFTAANDLTLAVTYTGGGINAPAGMAVDANGNVWIANSGTSTVTELSHTGTPAAGTPYSAGGINAPSAIAIDGSGDAWIANYGNATITELSAAGANVGSSPFSGGGLNEPNSLAFDGLGNLWVSNYGNSSASEFSSTGTALSPVGGYTSTGVSAPIGIAANAR